MRRRSDAVVCVFGAGCLFWVGCLFGSGCLIRGLFVRGGPFGRGGLFVRVRLFFCTVCFFGVDCFEGVVYLFREGCLFGVEFLGATGVLALRRGGSSVLWRAGAEQAGLWC